MKNFTIISNPILQESQLSISARYLYCVLRKYCGQDEDCFPSQATLALQLGVVTRTIRKLLKELISADLVVKHRSGFNKSNTYTVAKELRADRNHNSYHIGPLFPLHEGNHMPDKSTYIKAKGKRSLIGMKKLNDILIKKGLR